MTFKTKVSIALACLILTGAQYTRLNPVRVGDMADGTADHVLGWNGSGVAESQSRDGVRAANNSNIAVSNSFWQVITLNSERFDDNSMHSTSTNTSRLTATVAGRYFINAQIRWASNATGWRGVRIRLNATTEIAKVQADAASVSTIQNVTTLYNLAADDYVEMECFHTRGSSLDIEPDGNLGIEFMMQRVRAE